MFLLVPYVSLSWLIPCRLQKISRLHHRLPAAVPTLLTHVHRVSIGLNRADHFLLFMAVKGNDDKERILADMFSVSSASKRIAKNIQNDNIIDTTILEEDDAQDGDIKVTRGNATRQKDNHAPRDEVAEILFPSKGDAEEEEESDEMTIHEEINEIINILVAIDEMGEINNLKPSFLTERAHFLCNGKKYEEVYQARLKEDCLTPEQLERLQRVHSLLSGFISSEKKLRSRLKVNYILACILDKQMLEEAVKTLSSA